MGTDQELRLSLIAPALLGLLLRLGWWIESLARDPMYGRFLLDSEHYQGQARALMAGSFRLDVPYQLAPLYSYFLAAIQSLLGGGPGPVFAIQALLGAGTCLLASLLGARLAAPWDRPATAAWISGLLVALNPYLILYDARLLPVELSTFLLALSAILIERLWNVREGTSRTRSLATATTAGLVLGLSVLARANLLLVIPLIWAAFLIRAIMSRSLKRILPAALLIIGALLPLTFSGVHNARTGGGFAPVSVNGGFNLFMGNNPAVGEYAEAPFHPPGDLREMAERARLYASIEEDRWLDPSEADRWWRNRAVAAILGDPLRYGSLFLRKTHQLLGFREYSDNEDTREIASTSLVLRFLPSSWTLVVGLALFGITRRRPSPGEQLPLLLLLFGQMASIALFFVVDRYRLPLFPLLAAWAAVALVWIQGKVKARDLRSLAPGFAALPLLLLFLHLPATQSWLPWNLAADRASARVEPLCPSRRTPSRGSEIDRAFLVGTWLLQNGQKREASQVLQQLVTRDPSHPQAWVTLSFLALDQGKTAEAVAASSRAITADPCNEKAWANRATALLRSERWEDALPAARKAVEIEPSEPLYWSTLGEALLHLGRHPEARSWLERACRWSPEAWQARVALAQLAMKEQDWETARSWLKESLALQPRQGALWAMLGLTELALGNPREAAMILKKTKEAGLRDPALDRLAKGMMDALAN